MDRLSVDIDLCYLPIEPRDKTLEKIKTGLDTIAKNVKETLVSCEVETKYT